MTEGSPHDAFGAWLSGMLSTRGLSQAAFGRWTGVDHSVVSKWARGVQRPDPTSCQLIAEALDVPLDEVLVLAGHDPAVLRASGDEVKDRLHDLIDQVPSDQLQPFIAVFEEMVPGRIGGDRA